MLQKQERAFDDKTKSQNKTTLPQYFCSLR